MDVKKSCRHLCGTNFFSCPPGGSKIPIHFKSLVANFGYLPDVTKATLMTLPRYA